MKPDDHVCYCYSVSLRKLWNFVRRTRPRQPSQLSECLGAGTGCGWCIPILKRIFHEANEETPSLDVGLSAEEYAAQRQDYIREQKPKNRF